MFHIRGLLWGIYFWSIDGGWKDLGKKEEKWGG